MAASVFDSPLYAQLFPVGEAGRLFTDSAAIRAMLLVEGALARAQGSLGVIPDLSAAAIHRASLEITVDPGALASATGDNGVTVPGLVAAFRHEMQAPEHAQFVHWGATSQDIIDTGLMLRLRQFLALVEGDLREILGHLAEQAEKYSDLPMVARTYSQHATPTTWGAVLATWGMPLIDAVEAMPDLRQSSIWVSLSGASGTSAALGPKAAQTRAALAEALGLHDPGRSWHIDRGPLIRIADWLGQVMAILAGMATTLIALTSSDVAEVSLGHVGGSSTMPQKQNPVAPSAILALSHQMTGLRNSLQSAASHQHQRDGAAWFAEWIVLPQICLSAASALRHGVRVAGNIAPVPDVMRDPLVNGLGLVHAEALSFALADIMPRSDAQAAIKALCAQASEAGIPLLDLARASHPDLVASQTDDTAGLGSAIADANSFVERTKNILQTNT
ncbi:MAG: lyase family protein [Sulfitobacter sp.]